MGQFRCGWIGLGGLDHWRGIVWDPGIVDEQCLHVCYDCLCLTALFRDAMLLFHDWAALSMWTGNETGYCRTITLELGCLGSINPPCDVDRFFGCDEWKIKELEAVVTVGVMTFDSCDVLVCAELRCVSFPRECFRSW